MVNNLNYILHYFRGDNKSNSTVEGIRVLVRSKIMMAGMEVVVQILLRTAKAFPERVSIEYAH